MSDEKNYGRKIIRDKQKVVRRRNRYARRFFLFMAGCFAAGAVIGGLVTALQKEYKNQLKGENNNE